MLVYAETREQFTKDVFSNRIENVILEAFRLRLGISTSESEIRSWRNSMQYVNNVLLSAEIAADAGVAVEFKIPLTSRRIDFILTGTDEADRDSAIIVELKQWSDIKPTEKDGVVETVVGGGWRHVAHPSYQAWTYAALIRDYNEAVQTDDIQLVPCAYLHNCVDGAALKSDFYAQHTDQAPVFIREDVERLAEFIKTHVRHGDRNKVLYRIANGRLRPSKNLADHLASLLRGNREFTLIDDQKLVYEHALSLWPRAASGRKQVFIVEGGPGTGKSVVAINLLVELTQRERVVHYVTRNAAPRAVYESKLAGTLKKTRITNLFKGSGSYTDCTPNMIDFLVVDEAHRLNEKSGMFKNLGENQIKELIQAAKVCVFFVDEDQRVTTDDIGTAEEIARWAEKLGAEVHSGNLTSQFRCNGSDGYLAWVDHNLQIRQTANETLEGIDFDFQVCDSPNELRDLITEKNRAANKARMVAGYCWNWKGKKDPTVKDVAIPEHGFAMRWNLDTDGGLWILQPDSINEIGCIHTCQGLELDFVGVIIGPDLVVRDGQIVTDFRKRSSQDRSIRGLKKMAKDEPEQASEIADRIIKNTYRTLMTRGQKGCYLFCTDNETNKYFKQRSARTLAGETDTLSYLRVAEPSGWDTDQ
jgi:uncharacterized protein